MPDLFHAKAIDATLEEVRRAAQQAQVTLAAAQEMLQETNAKANALLDRLTAIVDAVSTVRK